MSKQRSKNSSATSPKPEKEVVSLVSRYQLSLNISTLFDRVIKDSIISIHFFPCERLSEQCEAQLVRLRKLKEQDDELKEQRIDNELTLSVVGIQARIMMQERRYRQPSQGRLSPKSRSSIGEQAKQMGVIRRYEKHMVEMERNDSEIRRFVEAEMAESVLDFANCYLFFLSQASKLKKNGKERLNISRLRLLQTLCYFLREAALRVQPQRAAQLQPQPCEQSIGNASLSFLQVGDQTHGQSLTYEQVNKWSRYSSKMLQQKIVQLSGICEQIPQLQTFKRTLQFSQLESDQRVCFFKVVEVLISLHHKVSYLSRNKPQLLRQLELINNELGVINGGAEGFLVQLTGEANSLEPIRFEVEERRSQTQLSQELSELRGYIIKMSEIISSQDSIHTQSFGKIERIVKLIELFGRVLGGQAQFVEEWQVLVNSEQQKGQNSLSSEQFRVLVLLDECLSMQRQRIDELQQNGENAQVNHTSEELEAEVNKLIEDYERLKAENGQLAGSLEIERQLREELMVEVDERDRMISNLSAVKIRLEKKLARGEGRGEGSVVSGRSRSKEEDLRRIEHDQQKYLQSSLLLKEQLRVSEAEREKLLLQLEGEKQQYVKVFESFSRIKPEKERLEIEVEELQSRLDSQKNEQLRHANRFNKIITDLTNDKTLLEMQLDTAERNNLKLMERLDLNEKKLGEYSKLMMARLEEKEDNGHLRTERENQRLRKDLENAEVEVKGLEQQNRGLREEVANLKLRVKESQIHREDLGESEQVLGELRGKVEKLQGKNQGLSRSLEEAKTHEEELEERLRIGAKRVKELEGKERDWESERGRLAKNGEESERRCQDLQRQLDDLRHWAERQTRLVRQGASKKDIDLLERQSKISSLELRIKFLQQQLALKGQQSDRVTQELVQTKVKQYQTTIETYKLIEVKLQQQARGLKKEIEGKVQNEVRLNGEIGRLSKEIDRMKAELDKFIRELTEKELVIKMERQKNEESLRQIREFEVKEKVREEQLNTPHRDKPVNEDDTPSQIEDHLGHSNIRYDNYFNAKEYDRLSKEYNDFKKHASQKIEALELALEQALKNNASLKVQVTGNQNSKNKPNNIVDQGAKAELQKLKGEINSLLGKNRELSSQNQDLSNVNKSLQGDLKKQAQRQLQYSSIIQNLKREKQQFESKVVQIERDKSTVNAGRQSQLLGRIRQLQDQIKKLEALNKQAKDAYTSLQLEMERQTRNMFEHYEGQMKRVITETEGVNSRLLAEVEALKRQLQVQSTVPQLDRERESVLNELKCQIEQLIAEKNRLIGENSRLVNAVKAVEKQREGLLQQVSNLRENNNTLNNTIHNSETKLNSSRVSEEGSRKIKQLTVQIGNLVRERDLIRSEHDSMREHLENQTKRALYLESQLLKLQIQLEQGKKSQVQSGVKNQRQDNLQYLYAKIRALQDALQAVGSELSDSKQQNNGGAQVPKGSSMAQSHIIALSGEQVELQRLRGCEGDWKKKQALYLQELQVLSRQNLNLKVEISSGRGGERPIVTNLPEEARPTNNTYSQVDLNRPVGIIRVERILQGKRRWQGMRFSESLSRWGVPPVVCQEVEDLKALFLSTSETIVTINQEQIYLQQVIGSLPALENVLEFVLRIVAFFSEVHTQSAEGVRMRAEIEGMGKQYVGGYLFTMLEEYTIHILQNNAIEMYKRELRAKAKELLEIKENLNQLINRQIEQEESMINRPLPINRQQLEPSQYRSSSVSSNRSSPAKK